VIKKGLTLAVFFLAMGKWIGLTAAEGDPAYRQPGGRAGVSSSHLAECRAATVGSASRSSISYDVSAEPVTSAQCNKFTFDATGSHLPKDRNVSFLWDFGDGEISREAVAEHTYKKAGDYTVTLSLTDDSGLACARAVHSKRVRVNLPPRAAFESPERACVREEIILDATPSFDEQGARLGYRWDFGDGSKEYNKKKIAKVYTKGGSYKISLTVDDNSGSVCSTATAQKIIRVNEPPLAEAGEDVMLHCVHKREDLAVTFDASMSRDVNNDALRYQWDFGDGQKGNGMQVTHVYAETGHYEVKLVVSDNTSLGCGTGVDFVTVRLNKAPKAEAGGDITACVDDEVVFDGTQSYTDRKGTLDGRWFFGDGQSAEGLKVTHRYRGAGTYQAALVVENRLNAMCPPSRDARTVTVNSAPAVVLRSADKVCAGETVPLVASAVDEEGNSLKYYWNFGDGTMFEDGPQVTHTYAQGGRYRISVIVDDGVGTACSTGTAIKYIHVNTPPVAGAGANLSCCAGIEADFNAASSADPDGDTLVYTWDFGDGTKSEGLHARYAYSQEGVFDVLLTVNDQTGTACSTSTAGFTAKVHDKPEGVINIR
jgi:PKD repeat protein